MTGIQTLGGRGLYIDLQEALWTLRQPRTMATDTPTSYLPEVDRLIRRVLWRGGPCLRPYLDERASLDEGTAIFMHA